MSQQRMCCATPWIVTLLSIGLIGLPHSAQTACSMGRVSVNGQRQPSGPRSNSTRSSRWYGLAVSASVRDVLKDRPGAWCLDCLVRHTRERASDVVRELDALAVRVEDGRCGTCAAAGPVFAPSRTR